MRTWKQEQKRRGNLIGEFCFAWEPIWAALDEMGHRSSLSSLQKRAIRLAPYLLPPSISYCVLVRKEWTKANGFKQADCRTYEGQPNRNMKKAA